MEPATHFYCLVNNIPKKFHSAELRNFFATFVEADKFDCFHFRHRPELIDPAPDSSDTLSSSTGGSNFTSGTTSQLNNRQRLCGLVRFNSQAIREEFVETYNKKFWVDKDGHDVYGKCAITRVKIGPTDIRKFSKELVTPNFMPKGNVGTPNKHFLELIRTCRLPPSLIKKLGLDFPTARSFRKYSKVHFDYGTSVQKGGESEDPVVETGKGVEISNVTESGHEKVHESSSSKETTTEEDQQDSEDDNDTCEEWERHETFDDDVTRQERCKERLYEEEIELVWEKGGPGIVWWTDTQYWNQQKGGFDESTSDQLDVDMQGYYSGGDPDKDARDMMNMRHRERLEQGLDSVSVFKKPVVPEPPKKKQIMLSSGTSLDKPITTEIGQKVMQKYGWSQGHGIGKKNQGIVDPVPHEGQHPSDKRGIGYYGEKLTFTKSKKPKVEDYDDEHRISIGTKYDRPADLDQPEPLLRRNAISFIKRYDSSRNMGS